MNKRYDFVVIGSGISACLFASYLNYRNPNYSILIVEQGRRIGGRSTTRKSRSYQNLEFDHGLTSINLSNKISHELSRFILPLIEKNKLIDITKDIMVITQNGDIEQLINYQIIKEKIYRGFPYMNCICNGLIKQAPNPSKINFLFEKFIKSFRKVNNLWEIDLDSKNTIKSCNLIISSSLIAHPRCLEIMNVQNIPLRNAFSKGQDELIEDLLLETSKLEYLKRKNYILLIKKSLCVESFNYKYLQILFSQAIKEKFRYEKIVFQKQLDGSLIIVLHCSYFNNLIDINLRSIINDMTYIFRNHQNFLDLFLKAQQFDIMNWRASQPINNLVSQKLQLSLANNIGFCGDWFDVPGCSAVERAMNSSLNLVKLYSNN